MANPEWGIEVLNKVWPRLSDIGNLEQPPKKDGRYKKCMLLHLRSRYFGGLQFASHSGKYHPSTNSLYLSIILRFFLIYFRRLKYSSASLWDSFIFWITLFSSIE